MPKARIACATNLTHAAFAQEREGLIEIRLLAGESGIPDHAIPRTRHRTAGQGLRLYKCIPIVTMQCVEFAGFEWDDGNQAKCVKHGLSCQAIEELFSQPVAILPDEAHSHTEVRYRAIGRTAEERYVFIVFTLRRKSGGLFIRPISARYMHRKEVAVYEKENPDLQE